MGDMRIARYVWCALLFLLLLALALVFVSIAVETWRNAEMYRSGLVLGSEGRETLIEEALGHAQGAAVLALLFGIGAALAVSLPFWTFGIARCISRALLFLLLLIPAVFFTWRAVDLALPFWIGAALAVALPLRAWLAVNDGE
jgi:hypothetical protein